MMNTATGRRESFLAQLMMEAHHRGGMLSSPIGRGSSGLSSLGVPRSWPLDVAPVTSTRLVSPPSSTAVSEDSSHDERKEESLTKSSTLDDDAFFEQYAKTFHPEKINKNEPFPLKLYRILYEAEKNNHDDIISFCPSGKSFIIHKTEEFVKEIMPKYFTSNRMTSFQRQLNLYGFRRRLRGDDKGGFWHQSFVHSQRNLCLTIKRKVQTFKVPPHLLSGHIPSSDVTPSSPVSSDTLATPRLSPSHIMMATQSPGLCDLDLPKMAAFSARSPLQDLHDSYIRGYSMPSLIPPMCLGLSHSVSSIHGGGGHGLVGRSSSPSTAELLRLNQTIQLAKERAAMKHHLAMSAIQRLVGRADM